MEKNLLEKVRKQVFYKHTNLETIKWEKTREKIYSRNTNIATKKRWKKIVWKKCEISFLLTHEYRNQKIGGKNREKKFFKKHAKRVSKK